MKLSIFSFVFSGLLVSKLFAQTDVSEDIAVDTTWGIGGSPYTITKADFSVADGAVLTIDANVIVNVDFSFTVNGALDINGTAGNEVTFNERVGGGWGYLAFARGATPESSDIEYAVFNDVGRTFSIDSESVTFSNCTFVASSNSTRQLFDISGDNADLDPDPLVTIENSSITYINEVGGDVQIIRITGLDTIVDANTIDYTATGGTGGGGAAGTVVGILVRRSDEEDYNFTASGNDITMEVTNTGKGTVTGIEVENVMATITDNVELNITAPNVGNGILIENDATVTGNSIVINVSAPMTDFMFYRSRAIESTSTTEVPTIENNYIVMTTDSHRDFYGIDVSRGTIRNNRILIDHDNANGVIYGILLDAVENAAINNTIRMVTTSNISAFGISVSDSGVSRNVNIRNNILSGPASTAARSIVQSEASAATVNHGYNLIFGWNANFSGGNLVATTGEIFVDPDFANTATLVLNNTSPAIDAGDWDDGFSNEPGDNGGRINMGAFGNTASAVQAGGGGTVIAAPEITSNAGSDFTVDDPETTLTGRTTSTTASVEVNGSSEGVTYTAGETSWSYSNSALEIGVNAFSVRSKTEGGAQTSAEDGINVTYADAVAPSVASSIPSDDATDVAIDSTVQITFADDDFDPATLIADSSLLVSGGVEGSLEVDGAVITYTPDSLLAENTLYTVTLTTDIEDEIGNSMATDYQFSFTTAGGSNDDTDDTEGESEESVGGADSAEAAGGCSVTTSNGRVNPLFFLMAFVLVGLYRRRMA